MDRAVYLPAPDARLLVLLPDNPEEKNASRFTFQRQVNAVDFLTQALADLNMCVESALSVAGINKVPIEQSVLTRHLGELEEGIKKSVVVIFEDVDGTRGVDLGQTEDRRIYSRGSSSAHDT